MKVEELIKEHSEMCLLLMQTVGVMRIVHRLLQLGDGHILMSQCREIEKWLDEHQQ